MLSNVIDTSTNLGYPLLIAPIILAPSSISLTTHTPSNFLSSHTTSITASNGKATTAGFLAEIRMPKGTKAAYLDQSRLGI